MAGVVQGGLNFGGGLVTYESAVKGLEVNRSIIKLTNEGNRFTTNW